MDICGLNVVICIQLSDSRSNPMLLRGKRTHIDISDNLKHSMAQDP